MTTDGKTKRRPGRPSGAGADANRRARLVDAALEDFAEFGYSGASLREIAKKSGGDLGLIRYYFGNKEDLWYGALKDLSERSQTELQQAMTRETSDEQQNAAHQLEQAIRWFLDMSARYPSLSRIIVSESSRPGDRQKFISQNIVGPFFDVMSYLIDEAKKEGAVPDVSTRTIFFMITHGGSFPMAIPALTNDMPGLKIATKSALQQHADAVVRLVLR